METIKIIEGLNKEKEMLTNALIGLENFGYTAVMTKVNLFIKRIEEIDSKLENIRKSLIVNEK